MKNITQGDDRSLADGFPAANAADWRKVADSALKGAAFDSLMTRTRDGLVLEPIYPSANVEHAIAGREGGKPWSIVQRMDQSDPMAAKRQALDDLNSGADGLSLVFRSALSARGHGLPLTIEDLSLALNGVHLDWIKVRIEAGGKARAASRVFADHVDKTDIDPKDLSVDFGFDPIGTFAARGVLDLDEEAIAHRLVETITSLETRGFAGPFINVRGDVFHNAGASNAQELSGVLANMVHLLRWVEAAGGDLDRAGDWIAVTLSADVDQFATIAKMRAMRLLWKRMLDASGIPFKPLNLHAETSWRVMTRRDPHVNILRSTIAAFAAGVGGADSVSVLPFSSALGLPDAFARRVARNTQLILIEESGLARTADPVAGAGYPESLTQALSETAWRIFQDIERGGGIIDCLRGGTLQQRIAEVRDERQLDIATLVQPITGTSAFPDLGTKLVEVLAPNDSEVQEPVAGKGVLDCQPLMANRDAAPFEALRDVADGEAEHGRPLTVPVFTLGERASFGPRLTWATNCLAAGGVQAKTTEDLADMRAVGDAIRQADSPIVCLCGTDADYDKMAPHISGTAQRVIVIGKPIASLKNAGITEFLHSGMNMVEFLSSLQSRIKKSPATADRSEPA